MSDACRGLGPDAGGQAVGVRRQRLGGVPRQRRRLQSGPRGPAARRKLRGALGGTSQGGRRAVKEVLAGGFKGFLKMFQEFKGFSRGLKGF